jgi:hypothetical protein
MAPLKPPPRFKFWFFSTPPSPLHVVNLKPINVETLNLSPNNDPLETLLKGKHKGYDNVVLEINYTSLTKQGEYNEPKKKK